MRMKESLSFTAAALLLGVERVASQQAGDGPAPSPAPTAAANAGDTGAGNLFDDARAVVESNFPPWAIYMLLAVLIILTFQVLFCVRNHKNEIKKLNAKKAAKLEEGRQEAMTRTIGLRKATTVDIDVLPEVHEYNMRRGSTSASRSQDRFRDPPPAPVTYSDSEHPEESVSVQEPEEEETAVIVDEMAKRVEPVVVDPAAGKKPSGVSGGLSKKRHTITVVPSRATPTKSKSEFGGERRLSVPTGRPRRKSSNSDKLKQTELARSSMSRSSRSRSRRTNSVGSAAIGREPLAIV